MNQTHLMTEIFSVKRGIWNQLNVTGLKKETHHNLTVLKHFITYLEGITNCSISPTISHINIEVGPKGPHKL